MVNKSSHENYFGKIFFCQKAVLRNELQFFDGESSFPALKLATTPRLSFPRFCEEFRAFLRIKLDCCGWTMQSPWLLVLLTIYSAQLIT
jgi:hypothetical protein